MGKNDRGPRRNEWIRVPEVLLINEKGEQLGVTKTTDAQKKAKEAGLDLVEVGANAKPPVCKIMDYSKYLYQQSKKQRKSKSSQKRMKEFKFSPTIEDHDINTRVKRSKEYLSKGHMVRLSMWRKGRQTKESAMEKFDEILTQFEDYSTIEPAKKSEGRKIFITYKPNA
jgi:translation initiation factor IF-3